jgi:hypothetical protein
VSVISDERVAANKVRFIESCLFQIKNPHTGDPWYMGQDELSGAIIAASIVHGCNEIARAIREASK